jgi:hypothetical protein
LKTLTDCRRASRLRPTPTPDPGPGLDRASISGDRAENLALEISLKVLPWELDMSRVKVSFHFISFRSAFYRFTSFFPLVLLFKLHWQNCRWRWVH